EVLGLVSRWRLEASLVTCSAAASACEKRGRWREALALLRQVQMRRLGDVIIFNAAIAACEQAGRWRQALALLAELEGPSRVSFGSAIACCAGAYAWRSAWALLAACGAETPPGALEAAMAVAPRQAQEESAAWLLKLLSNLQTATQTSLAKSEKSTAHFLVR
ncbi:unnamed protein product, partial [Effrenium voratum]